MSIKTASDLHSLLNLEKLDDNLFRGQNYITPWGRIYGGQVLAQGLHAAYQTVPKESVVHSMHGYFILAGDVNQPVIYDVECIRNGRSFNTRRVVAIQKGRAIFNMAASFQVAQPSFEHQLKMPKVLPPEEVITDQEWAAQYKDKLPELYQRYQDDRPLEFRPVEKFDPINPKNQPPFRNIWIKAKGTLPDDLRVHQEVLTYAADYNLLGTAILPHREEISNKETFFASLDHAMWYHHDFRVDDWLLYSLESPSASNTRGFTRGSFFNRDGKLVASVVQEGLIRYR